MMTGLYKLMLWLGLVTLMALVSLALTIYALVRPVHSVSELAATPGNITLSLRSFGAVGDGVANDTAAVQRAAASQRAVKVSKGTYRLTAPITMSAYTSFYGEGTVLSVLLSQHAGAVLSFTNIITGGTFLRDLQIQGPGQQGTGVFISSPQEETSHMYIENVQFYNLARGTDCTLGQFALFDSYLASVDFLQCSEWGLQLGGSQLMLDGCSFRLCKWGVYQIESFGDSIGGGTFQGCTFVGNDFDVVAGNNYVRPLRFNSCWFEQTKYLTLGKLTTGELFFVVLVFDACIFQPEAGANGNGVIDSVNFKGTVAFENCAVFASPYTNATLPETITMETNVSYRRVGCYIINPNGSLNFLANVNQTGGTV